MKIKKYNEPWTHLIIDDFIDDDSFRNLQNNFEDIHRLKGESNRMRVVYPLESLPLDISDSTPSRSIKSRTLVNTISKSVIRIWEDYYHDINHGVDESNLASQMIYECLRTHPFDKGYRSTHTDSEHKLMSVIYYVSTHGAGTTLCKRETEDEIYIDYPIEWKPNRAVVFVRKRMNAGGTWHYIHNDIPHMRHTMNFSIFMKKD